MDFAGSNLFSKAVELHSGIAAQQADLGAYCIDFIPKGERLVITFENAGEGGGPDFMRDGWGYSFLKDREYSFLGVKGRAHNWYRGKVLHDFFRSADFQAFAGQFKDHCFMGASMGGYGALAFSEVLPGALVIAHNPQTTLDANIVPWDNRFNSGRKQDWGGDFADAAPAARLCRRLYVTYDPFNTQDRRHAERISGANTVMLKMPFLGHSATKWLRQMGVLSQITDLALQERLTPENFAPLARGRRALPRYYLTLYAHTKDARIRDLALVRGRLALPEDPELRRLEFKHYFQLQAFGKILELLQEQPDLSGMPAPMQGEIRAIAGIAMHRTGHPAAAIAEIAAAIDQDFGDAAELIASAQLMFELSDYDMAQKIAAAAIAIAPRQRQAYAICSRSLHHLHRKDAALATLAEAERNCGPLGAELNQIRAELMARV